MKRVLRTRFFPALFLIGAMIFLLGGVSAGFTVVNSSSVDLSYSSGEKISGIIKLNLSDQENGFITTNFNSAPKRLVEIIEKGNVVGEDYICSPESCDSDYAPSIGEEMKSKAVKDDDNINIGLKAGGSNTKITGVNSFNLSLNSNASFSCSESQIEIDFFNDGSIDVINTNYRDFECGRSKGCFSSQSTSDYNIGKNRYCELIPLASAPAYRIGGNVLNRVDGTGVRLELRDGVSNDLLGDDCIVTSEESGFQEFSCIVNYSSAVPFNAFVCISSDDSGYKIKGEDSGEVCGKFGIDSEDFVADYDLFGASLQYGSVDLLITLDSYEEQTGKNLLDEFEGYVGQKYLESCGENGCIFPLSLISADDQTVNLGPVNLEYSSSQGSTTERKIYDLEESEAKITSLETLDINLRYLNITVPEESGEVELIFYLDEEELFSQMLNVSLGFDFSISPSFSFIGRETEFEIVTSENITSSSWRFGDGTLEVNSVGKKAKHRYAKEGNFDLTVEAKSSSGDIVERKFSIFVGDAKASARLSLEEYDEALTGFEGNLSKNYPSWLADKIREEVNLENVLIEVENLQEEFDLAGVDGNYTSLALKLAGMNSRVPRKISVSESGGAPMEVSFSQIDTDHIYQISDTERDSRRKIEEDILTWMSSNYENSVSYRIHKVKYGSSEDPILTSFEIELNKIGSGKDKAYLIIEYPLEEIEFSGNLGAEEVGGSASYLVLEGENKERIEFAVAGESRVESLRAYISPDVRDLGSSGGLSLIGLIRPPKFRTLGFFIWLFVIILLTLGIYIGLQEWYKRRYESYLFKNGSDLYNIINFIYNARKSGLKDEKIRAGLKSRKWKGEQVTYAFKKIDGKRTGMFEIPLFKFVENKKVRREIGKRQTGPVDTRFIKRPRL